MEFRAHPVHARPDAGRRDRLLDLRPADVGLRVPAGPDLHEPPPRRRDQPRPAEDAGGAARGDAGAAGDDRGDHATARAAVPRPRDAEPDRVRGHLPAARGPARPLPAAHRRRLSDPRRRVERARGTLERREDEVELEPIVDARRARRDAARGREVHVAESIGYYVSTSSPPRARARASRSARARAARSP